MNKFFNPSGSRERLSKVVILLVVGRHNPGRVVILLSWRSFLGIEVLVRPRGGCGDRDEIEETHGLLLVGN